MGESALILVLVGTHFRGFERLVRKADEIARRTDEEFVIQIGSTRFVPKNSRFFNAASHDHLLELIERARLVVCHAGVGCVLDCLGLGKIPIIVPRLRKFGEARDDHQLELAGLLAGHGKAVVVMDTEELEQAIRDQGYRVTKPEIRGSLIPTLKRYLRSLSEQINGVNLHGAS